VVEGWAIAISPADQREDVPRQMQRLRDDAAACGYQVTAEVTEIASGLNDERPKRKKLLTDSRMGVLVVTHKDRLTRLGYAYIATRLACTHHAKLLPGVVDGIE
jgi:predicted site-specific integrase-resolvase